MNQKNWISLMKEYKTLVGIIIAGLFIIEFEIFTFAAMNSGKQSWIQVTNHSGKIIYEVKGSTLANFDKNSFEKTFGPFKNYDVKLKTKYIAFPFRAWFSAAIGIPVGLVLLLAFMLKAAMVFIYGGEDENRDEKTEMEKESIKNKKNKEDIKNSDNKESKNDKNDIKNNKLYKNIKSGTGLEQLLLRISRFNIFIIGFLVICMVFLLWIIPNTLTFMAETGIKTILEFKWVFLGGLIAVFLLFAWFMYMKYNLAKKSIDAETEIRKYQLQLEYKQLSGQTGGQTPALNYHKNREIKQLEYPDESSLNNEDK